MKVRIRENMYASTTGNPVAWGKHHERASDILVLREGEIVEVDDYAQFAQPSDPNLFVLSPIDGESYMVLNPEEVEVIDGN